MFLMKMEYELENLKGLDARLEGAGIDEITKRKKPIGIVICPLIALLRDQVEAINQLNEIHAEK